MLILWYLFDLEISLRLLYIDRYIYLLLLIVMYFKIYIFWYVIFIILEIKLFYKIE